MANPVHPVHPLVVQEVFDDDKSFFGWAVEGRPADCVKLALLELLPQHPDVIISGIGYLWRDEIAKMPSSWPVREVMAK